MDDSTLLCEAEIFGKYLINQSPSQNIKLLFTKAALVDNSISVQDKKLLNFIIKNTWSIGLIDSGLAILNPKSEVRRRLYIMFAILESSPEHNDYFLTIKRRPLYFLIILLSGIRSFIKSFLGILLVKIIR